MVGNTTASGINGWKGTTSSSNQRSTVGFGNVSSFQPHFKFQGQKQHLQNTFIIIIIVVRSVQSLEKEKTPGHDSNHWQFLREKQTITQKRAKPLAWTKGKLNLCLELLTCSIRIAPASVATSC